jgi:hypothetical protein
LHRTLTQALDLADRLELPMVAIHIDEARNLLIQKGVTATH